MVMGYSNRFNAAHCALLGMLQGRALDGLRALRKQPVNTKLLSETQVRGVGLTMA